MKEKEFQELSTRARYDGQRLYAVTNALHKIGLVVPVILGLVGVLGGAAVLSEKGVLAGAVIISLSLLLSWVLYLTLTMTSSLCKVAVHGLFCLLAQVEGVEKSTDSQ
jgi:hypothetical protein